MLIRAYTHVCINNCSFRRRLHGEFSASAEPKAVWIIFNLYQRPQVSSILQCVPKMLPNLIHMAVFKILHLCLCSPV